MPYDTRKSKSANGQVTAYSSKLQSAKLAHLVTFVAAALLVATQLLVNLSPAIRSNASSTNDIINGGIAGGDPRTNLLRVYDQDRDSAGHTGYQTLFAAVGIDREDLPNTRVTTVSSENPNLVVFNRNHTETTDQAIQLTTERPDPVTPAGCNDRLPFQPGARGECILYFQRLLNGLGVTVPEDGVFGPATVQAVRNFQLNNGLPQTGLIDHPTWTRAHQLTFANVDSQGQLQTLYMRPLNLWRPGTEPDRYDALVGQLSTGQLFYILIDCGNLVIPTTVTPPPPTITPPPPTVTPPPPTITPPPPTVTPPPPTVTPPPPTVTPPPPTPLQPVIEQSKSASYVNRVSALAGAIDAHGTTAKAGDVIRYSLYTHNRGQTTKSNYQITEQLADVLEYADIIDLGGATLLNNTLTWPNVNIPPGTTLLRTFVIRVKSPIPDTPLSTSDPKSFDLRMDNVYGNQVTVKISAPPAKQIEAIVRALPQTGKAAGFAGISFFAALSFYFYQLHKQLLRASQTP